MRRLLPLWLLLTAFAEPTHRIVADRCEAKRCRCFGAAALNLPADELVRRQRDEAERVVFGRVVRIDTLAPHPVKNSPTPISLRDLVARVAVSRVWKGPRVDTLSVAIGTAELRMCGDMPMEPGASYVIFALRWEGGPLYTDPCAGTKWERYAAATISTLGTGREPRR